MSTTAGYWCPTLTLHSLNSLKFGFCITMDFLHKSTSYITTIQNFELRVSACLYIIQWTQDDPTHVAHNGNNRAGYSAIYEVEDPNDSVIEGRYLHENYQSWLCLWDRIALLESNRCTVQPQKSYVLIVLIEPPTVILKLPSVVVHDRFRTVPSVHDHPI